MMRKMNIVIFFFVICLLPNIVNAEEYITNQNNVTMTQSEYNNLSNVYSDAYIMIMTQEKFNELKNIDFSNVQSETKFVETTYNNALGIVTNRELTESEYNNINPNEGPTARASDSIETTYKKLTLYVNKTSNLANITLTCKWKYIPATRSYDVNGVRLQNYTISQGSQDGLQIYSLSNSSGYNSISYSATGTNIQRHSNGFGISMNIVNDDIDYLESTINASATIGSGTIAVYGAYQHSTTNLTLAQSQNYTLGAAGLGKVFVYPYSISQYLDGMGGVEVLG